MANFSDLPTEIWLLIGRHLSVPRLAKLKSLNSFFFNYYMDLRWERIEIDASFKSNASRVVRDLERMIDPFVATRPKLLTIRLISCQYLSTKLHTSLPLLTSMPLLTSLPLLPSITSLNITILDNFASYSATLFQTIISSSIARTLEKLRLTVSVDSDTFRPLAEYSAPNGSFESLTVLHLDLDLRHWARSHLRTEFPPALSSFLRSRAPTLRRLRLSDDSGTHDLCPLFDTLFESFSNSPIPFPRLDTLILFFHFDNAETLQASHQSLLRFLLARHNDLRYLRLKLNVPTSNPDENHLGLWLTELVNNSQFSSLQTLGIYPSNTPAGLSAVLALIKRTALTLTSLIIYDLPLTYEDAARVLDALTESEVQDHTTETTMKRVIEKPRNLKSLEMTVTQLSVPFLDLLACKLLQLEKLSLSAVKVVGFDQHSFCDLLHRRRYNPDITFTQDILHTWQLQDLEIRSGKYLDRDKDAIRAVAGAVPALARRMQMSCE